MKELNGECGVDIRQWMKLVRSQRKLSSYL